MKIVVLGPQGSGKSTQAALLSQKLHLPHVSTGDIFRCLEHDISELGQRVKSQLSQGLLVSDDDTFSVLTREFSKPDYQKGVIVDGFPRNLYQAQNSPLKFDKAIYLRVSDEVSTTRLLNRQREDDTAELIKERLAIYHTETEPILDLYRQQGILVEINGEQTVEEIFADIVRQLDLTDAVRHLS